VAAGRDGGPGARILRDLLRALLRAIRGGRTTTRRSRVPAGRSGTSRRPRAGASPRTAYPGDYRGVPRVEYRPSPDGVADPGEIVWTWVPYEEDHTRGKDRPVLVVGRDGRWLLGLMLSSKDHVGPGNRRDADPARGRGRWLDLGAGAWDSRRRPSEVRLDRVVRVDPGQVRREGAVLPRPLYDRVARALRG
jgi:hypothetical protein